MSVPARQRTRRALLLGFLLLFPLTFNYYSPALPVMGALEGVAGFSVAFWITWTVAALVFGRAGCGWACPLGALQEVFDGALAGRARTVRWLLPLRWVLFAAWMAAIGWALVRGPGWRTFDPLYKTENVVSWDRAGSAVIYVAMFGLVLLAAVPLGKRGFCRHVCWWAPLSALPATAARGLRLPVLQLSRGAGACADCGRCDAECLAGLRPRDVADGGVGRIDCVACGSCADGCARGALRLGWNRG
ncbi:MAG: 4Fe-4S binding protein [Anaeromyxobacter sp.]